MTAPPEGKPVILTAAEAAFIKETLYRCYATLDRACFASPAARAAAQDAAWQAAGEHVTLNKVLGDASLAMDYIDFAAPGWEAKELTHKAYERLRDPLTGKAEETELEAYQRRVNAFVKRPPDVFRIEDYPPEKRDG